MNSVFSFATEAFSALSVPVVAAGVGAFCLAWLLLSILRSSAQDVRGPDGRLLHLPPGPPCFPLFGPIPLPLPKNAKPNFAPDRRPFYQRMLDLKERYGPIFRISFARRSIVIVSDARLLKTLFLDMGEAVAGRMNVAMIDFMNPEKYGLLTCEGQRWKEQRRFSLHTLRNFGFAKKSSENTIQFEMRELVAQFNAERGPIDPQWAVSGAVTNVISMLVFAERLAQNPEFLHINKLMNDAIGGVDLNAAGVLLQAWSLLVPFDPFGVKALRKGFETGAVFVAKCIEKHRETLDPSNPRDYIDAFLIEMKGKAASNEEHYFDAGQETTSTSLRWGLLMMAKHPHIQKRVQDEIDAGIGHREPLYEDRLQLPFTESVMHESMRFTTTVPLAPHRVMSPVQIDGYDLPVGTYVIGNLYAMLHDPKVWPDPDHFNPDANFPINVKDEAEKEKLNARLESFIPFSVGKRMCVGDTLARQEFFIIFVGLLQHFTIAADPSKPLPSEYIAPNGTTRVPLPHKLVFQRRA